MEEENFFGEVDTLLGKKALVKLLGGLGFENFSTFPLANTNNIMVGLEFTYGNLSV